jgi:ribonuclease Z
LASQGNSVKKLEMKLLWKTIRTLPLFFACPCCTDAWGQPPVVPSFAGARHYSRTRKYGIAPMTAVTKPSDDAVTSPLLNDYSGAASPSAKGTSEQAVTTLASTILAMLAGNESAAESLAGGAQNKKQMIHSIFSEYDVCDSGVLSRSEAQALFTNLARSIVTELARDSTATNAQGAGTDGKSLMPNVARAHAQRVLADDEAGDTIARVATKLLMLTDEDGDGRISLPELAAMFDTVRDANSSMGKKSAANDTASTTDDNDSRRSATFPKPLRALAGSLQLLPPTEGTNTITASNKTSQWHLGVPGDDHTLRHVSIGQGLSVVGLGRSADASAYFIPELGIVLDAGIHVKSLAPKTVLLTHGHRDHIAALPTHAANKAHIYAPALIAPLVQRFLFAEAQLNYGDPTQTDDETVAALGDFQIHPVEDGLEQLLPKMSYTGSPTPIGIQVLQAPHKSGVPAVSYGIYRSKNRLKAIYADLPKNELGKLLRDNSTISLTESYEEGVLFYTGDTTIHLLRKRWREILPKYPYIIHEVTFLGMPSSQLDATTQQKGHTHYAQLHPWISAFPETTFICVHWSLRYSRTDILAFFDEQYGGVPKNVVLWV